MLVIVPGLALAVMTLHFSSGPAAIAAQDLQPAPAVVADADAWHTDYAKACEVAKLQSKMLLIVFQTPGGDLASKAFEDRTLADPRVQELLKRFVKAKLPLDARIRVNGQEIKLFEHPSFAEMLQRQGLVIIDYANRGTQYYGAVVSTFPFSPGLYYTTEPVLTMLDLPPGTLTQRTMIFAVRTHPEAPASAHGNFHPVLAGEAASHSDHQARIRVQGHHSWETRFHRINGRIGNGSTATEVVAESWPGETLVEACIECVHSWRQSPGHWRAVRSSHSDFGFDIRRGLNGIWYATGIFSGFRH